ncbi:MAG: hypothetical protein WAL63_11625 [Solirubrobacteraceae bacterium]
MTSRYEDALWDEIVDSHYDELADLRMPPPAPRRRPQAVVGATVLTAVGVGVAVITIAASSTTAPAYAVTRNPNGSVSVTLRQLSAIADVNARLKTLGVRAVVTRTGSQCASVPTKIVRVSPVRVSPSTAPGDVSWTQRATVPGSRAARPGVVRVLIASRSAGGRIALVQGQSTAQVPACVREIRIFAGRQVQIIGSGTPESSGPVQTPAPGSTAGSAGTASNSSTTTAGSATTS